MTVVSQKTQIADLIRLLFFYLKRNAEPRPALTPVLSMLRTAVNLYAAGQYAQANTQSLQVYQVITVIRRTDPSLPEP